MPGLWQQWKSAYPCRLRSQSLGLASAYHHLYPYDAQMEELNRKEPTMKPYDDCIYCGGQVEERLERIDYRYHGQLFIIE